MKAAILLVVLFMQIDGLCQIVNLEAIKKIYQFKKANGHSDIILLYDTSSTLYVGMYIGVEMTPEGTPFYYSSHFTAAKNTTYDIAFGLKKFSFSKEPAYINQANYLLDTKKLPYILQHPMTYFGKFEDKKLIIQRITTAHLFSSADDMTFFEINSLPER